MKKAALHNLGCKVNAYETEAMRQQLEEAGYEIVSFQEKADVYVINTCTVTNIADRKSRQMLHKAKKNNPNSIVAAVGCYVQAASGELEKDSAVDLIVGNNRKKDLVNILEEFYKDKEKKGSVIDINAAGEYEVLKLDRQAEHTRANIKVQDGCNQFCSYCIIPYTRGRVRSRAIPDVEEEVRNLAVKGYKEIVLTGIHLSSYGVDFKDDTCLLDLIKAVHLIDGIERIRLGSLEPRIITKEFVQELSGLKKVCPHFHLSLQSGCDETLRRMNRAYTTGQYYNKCKLLREYFKNPAITTDIIAGFPGETQEEFDETCSFVKKVNFTSMHVFKYSARKGTKAAGLKNQVQDSLKADRSNILLKLSKEMNHEYMSAFLNRKTVVLTEEEMVIEGEKYLIGHTKEYIKAAVCFQEKHNNKMLTVTPVDFLTDEILLAELRNMV